MVVYLDSLRKSINRCCPYMYQEHPFILLFFQFIPLTSQARIANLIRAKETNKWIRRLFFFDIDGTLLDHDKKLPASTKKSVQKLKQQGHEVAIATGRAPFVFENICKELQINTYVGLNGQYVV